MAARNTVAKAAASTAGAAASVGKKWLYLLCDVQEIFRPRIHLMPSVIHTSQTLVRNKEDQTHACNIQKNNSYSNSNTISLSLSLSPRPLPDRLC